MFQTVSKFFLPCAFAFALIAPQSSAVAASYEILYDFQYQKGREGHGPTGTLIMDGAGNLYGTTCCGDGNGTVYALSPEGQETVLAGFKGRSNGADPWAGVIADSAGNLYGTTYKGGEDCCRGGSVYKIATDGTETILYGFAGGRHTQDGDGPHGSLIADQNGNFYGTTIGGGSSGRGTIFEITAGGTEAVLYSFKGGSDGAYPQAGLITDGAGNFFGTTFEGGGTGCGDNFGCGTVFKLGANGIETVLYAFKGASDGANPMAGLIEDDARNLYGTTSAGAGTECDDGYGCGSVFRIAPDGKEKILHAFQGGNDGAGPYAGLLRDNAGNLYGTTAEGGGLGCDGFGCGTVFKISPKGTETILHVFAGGTDGSRPIGGLLEDSAGNFYGTTQWGGGTGCGNDHLGCGTVFKLTP